MDSWWIGKTREQLESEAADRARERENRAVGKMVPGLKRAMAEDKASFMRGSRRGGLQTKRNHDDRKIGYTVS
jgi:hypothetical protein